MTREAMINTETLDPRFIRYNPCYYCKRTNICDVECLARTGFILAVEEHLTYFYRENSDEIAIDRMTKNAHKYGVPYRTYTEPGG